MRIRYTKDFDKAFLKLAQKKQDKVEQVINIFRQNPHHSQLKNHALHGEHKGNRPISAGGDLRLVFREENNYEMVVFLSVGTHSQLY